MRQAVENQIDGRPENLESGASLPVLSKDRGCTLTESEVDTQIIKYRALVERMFGEPLDSVERLHTGFSDGTDRAPVSAVVFLHSLKFGRAEEFLSSLYRRKPRYPACAMLKSLMLMDIKRMLHYTELADYLKSNPLDAALLGFRRSGDRVEVPSVKTLWHFHNTRIGKGWDRLFEIIRDWVIAEGKTMGMNIGERCAEDSIPITAMNGDRDAEYNDHYKITGYKLDTINDIEVGLPMAKKTVTANAADAPMLQERVGSCRQQTGMKDIWIDGGYDSYENIGWLQINGIMPHFHIHENWVLNPAGSIEHITALYNSHWKDAGYRTGASTGYMLTFLFNHGRYEEVGAYFRNIEMLRYEADPASYHKDYHLRSRKEGNHGYWKEHLALQKRLRVRGIESVDRYLTRNLCTILAVALNRLQHGVRAHLSSVAYLK